MTNSNEQESSASTHHISNPSNQATVPQDIPYMELTIAVGLVLLISILILAIMVRKHRSG